MISNVNELYLYTLGFWIIFYNVAYQILRRKIPIPSKIRQIESPTKRAREFSSHVFSHLSLFHAIVNLAVSSYIFFSRPFTLIELNQKDTLHLLCFSAGYYLSNTLMGRVYKFHPLSMVCHHLVVLTEIGYAATVGVYGNIIIVGFAIAEASNPFRIIKNISDGHLEQKHVGDLSIKIFAVVFLFCRYPHQSDPLPLAVVEHPERAHSPHPEGVCGRLM